MRVAPFVPSGMDRLSMVASLGLLLTLARCLEKPSRPASEGPPQAGVIALQPHLVTFVTELPSRTSAIAISEVRPQVTGVILLEVVARIAGHRRASAVPEVILDVGGNHDFCSVERQS